MAIQKSMAFWTIITGIGTLLLVLFQLRGGNNTNSDTKTNNKPSQKRKTNKYKKQ